MADAKIGTLSIDKAYIGSDEVQKMYLGETEVWSKTAPVTGYNVTFVDSIDDSVSGGYSVKWYSDSNFTNEVDIDDPYTGMLYCKIMTSIYFFWQYEAGDSYVKVNDVQHPFTWVNPVHTYGDELYADGITFSVEITGDTTIEVKLYESD